MLLADDYVVVHLGRVQGTENHTGFLVFDRADIHRVQDENKHNSNTLYAEVYEYGKQAPYF